MSKSSLQIGIDIHEAIESRLSDHHTKIIVVNTPNGTDDSFSKFIDHVIDKVATHFQVPVHMLTGDIPDTTGREQAMEHARVIINKSRGRSPFAAAFESLHKLELMGADVNYINEVMTKAAEQAQETTQSFTTLLAIAAREFAAEPMTISINCIGGYAGDDLHDCLINLHAPTNTMCFGEQPNHPDGWYRKFEKPNRGAKNLRPHNYKNFTRGGKR